MKYKFVYDDSFLKDNGVFLSNREFRVALATAVGNHNAFFYGYDPERLVKAVKLIHNYAGKFIKVPEGTTHLESCVASANDGVLYIPHIYDRDISFVSSLEFITDNGRRSWQVLCTSQIPPQAMFTENIQPYNILSDFDIVFCCGDINPQLFSKTQFRQAIINANDNRKHWESGNHITGRLSSVKCYWYNNERNYYTDSAAGTREFSALKVARSLSDIDGITCALQKHYDEAKLYVG